MKTSWKYIQGSLVEDPDYKTAGRSVNHSLAMNDVHQNPEGRCLPENPLSTQK